MKKSDFSINEWQKIYHEVHEKLVYQAKAKQAISYGELCKAITTRKLKPTDEALHDILGEVSAEEIKKGNGLLSVFCGSKNDNLMPGDGFFKLAYNLGIYIGNKETFVKQERDKLHQKFRDFSMLTF
jgi:hypothetical protein